MRTGGECREGVCTLSQPNTMLIPISKLMRIAILATAVLIAAAAWAQNSTGRIIGNQAGSKQQPTMKPARNHDQREERD
jgi:hypothetical protein